jgi:hypothetical protein
MVRVPVVESKAVGYERKLLVRWPPIHVPVSVNCAPWLGHRNPFPVKFTMLPWCGQMRDSAR